MSAPHSDSSSNGRLNDDEILRAHRRAEAAAEDHGANYHLLPLVLLFIFSSLVLFGGIYIARHAGDFAATVFDARAKPHLGELEQQTVSAAVIGKRYYESYCFTCHQNTGLGQPGIFPPLAGSEWVTGDEAVLVRILLHGLTGPITVAGSDFGVGASAQAMPAIGPGGQGWSDDRIAAVASYIRQAWGNEAPEIATATVTEIRTADGQRSSWTAAELQALP